MTAVDPVAALADARAHGFGLGVERITGDWRAQGWRPATLAAEDVHLREELIARSAAGAGTPSRAVAATWLVERHVWLAAGAALAGVLVHGAIPPLDAALLRDGEYGWADAIALPDTGWTAVGGGAALAAHLEAHLHPLVEAFACERPRRALWRSAADRLGQAALWCGEAFGAHERAWTVAGDALTADTALHAPAGFMMRAGRPFRRRIGCCLSHRCPGGDMCDDCPLPRRRAGWAEDGLPG
jgi:FhuF 2Fe-2S C-terminal domain